MEVLPSPKLQEQLSGCAPVEVLVKATVAGAPQKAVSEKKFALGLLYTVTRLACSDGVWQPAAFCTITATV